MVVERKPLFKISRFVAEVINSYTLLSSGRGKETSICNFQKYVRTDFQNFQKYVRIVKTFKISTDFQIFCITVVDFLTVCSSVHRYISVKSFCLLEVVI